MDIGNSKNYLGMGARVLKISEILGYPYIGKHQQDLTIAVVHHLSSWNSSLDMIDIPVAG